MLILCYIHYFSFRSNDDIIYTYEISFGSRIFERIMSSFYLNSKLSLRRNINFIHFIDANKQTSVNNIEYLFVDYQSTNKYSILFFFNYVFFSRLYYWKLLSLLWYGFLHKRNSLFIANKNKLNVFSTFIFKSNLNFYKTNYLNIKVKDPLFHNLIMKFSENSLLDYKDISFLDFSDEVYVQDFLDKNSLGVNRLSNWYLYGYNYNQAAFFSVSDFSNALNAYNYSTLSKSFNIDQYNPYYKSKKFPIYLKHREKMYKLDGIPPFLDLLFDIGDYVDSQAELRGYSDLTQNLIETFFTTFPTYYNMMVPFVFNNTYDLEYSILVVSEFKYYWRFKVHFYIGDIFSLNKFLKAVIGDYALKKKSLNPFKRYSKSQFNLFHNFGINSDFMYNAWGDNEVYKKRFLLEKRFFKYDDHDGEFSSLIFSHKFLSYNYLMNFVVSMQQWQLYFSKNLSLDAPAYSISNAFHDFIPQSRSNRERLESWTLYFHRMNILDTFISDPVQFVEGFDHRLDDFWDNEKIFKFKSNYILDLMDEEVNDFRLRSAIINRIVGGRKKKRNKWRSYIYSKYFRRAANFFLTSPRETLSYNWRGVNVSQFTLVQMPWISCLIRFFLLL